MSVKPAMSHPIGRVTPCAPALSSRSGVSVERRQFTSVGDNGALPSRRHAFTLLELIVVIGIIGVVASISVPAIKNMQKADAVATATRQMQDALARARQFAISQRTTVYMVFVPAEFWLTAPTTPAANSPWAALLDKQLTGYNFLSLREVGGQPGRYHPRYLDEWRSLPEGMFIAPHKFNPRSAAPVAISSNFWVHGFERGGLPFPTGTDAGVPVPPGLPYIAFNHLGQMVSDRDQEIIPLTRGSVSPAVDANKIPQFSPPTITERPPGNSTSSAFTLIVVDRLTGRAHVERQQIQ